MRGRPSTALIGEDIGVIGDAAGRFRRLFGLKVLTIQGTWPAAAILTLPSVDSRWGHIELSKTSVYMLTLVGAARMESPLEVPQTRDSKLDGVEPHYHRAEGHKEACSRQPSQAR